MCTAPKLIVKIHPNASLNFCKIRLPEVKVGREKQCLCGPAHVHGMECTCSICRFVHFPPSGLAALDAFDREKVHLCVYQSQAIDWDNAWRPDNSCRLNQGVSWHQSTIRAGCDTPPSPASTVATAAASNQPVPPPVPPGNRGPSLPCNINIDAYTNQSQDQSQVLS